MTYSVKYKTPGAWFWKNIRKIEADGILVDMTANVKSVIEYRWFLLEDKTRVEIPMAGTIFVFGPERFHAAKKSMEEQAGQTIPTK